MRRLTVEYLSAEEGVVEGWECGFCGINYSGSSWYHWWTVGELASLRAGKTQYLGLVCQQELWQRFSFLLVVSVVYGRWNL